MKLVWLGALALAAGATPPPRVRRGAKGWGGGSADLPGHMKRMQDQPGKLPLKELFEVPSWEVFHHDYIKTNTPVVLRGHVKTLSAYERWTDEYLIQNWGSRKVQVEMNKTETRGGPTKEITVKKLIEEMYKEKRKDQLYAIIDFDTDMKARADFEMPSPINCNEIKPQSLTLWMSSGDTKSVLHNDDAENLLMLLAGNKSVMLVHQDYAQKMYAPIAEAGGTSPVHQSQVDLVNFPKFNEIKWIYGEIGPGDTLYIPHTYWHQVDSYGRNLAVNLWWGHVQDWQWWDPQNEKEYSSPRFGSKGFGKFDDLKARGGSTYPCTKLAEGTDMSKIKFTDEGKFKSYVSKKHKANKKAAASGEL